MDLQKRKVTILGLGRHGGGIAAARYCAEQGAIVTVTDLADETSLAESVQILTDAPIAKFILGQHRETDFIDANVVVVNPAVKPDNRFVELARTHGAAVTSETELFLNACPSTVIGVTGTVGKSTTCAMLAAMLRANGKRTWLGGNIGNSLLVDLPKMQRDDLVVLELSSFQLHWLNEDCRWPMGAIITNCSPNHLDWHGSWEHYVASKQRLISHLPKGCTAVIDDRDAEMASWKNKIDTAPYFAPLPLESIPPLQVPGEHNRRNAALAARMAINSPTDEEKVFHALREFTGLPHRLAFVAEIAGRWFYNDSKSTTPAATIAALNTMDRPTWLLLGGADKQIDLTPLVHEVASRAEGVAAFGAVADQLDSLLKQHGGIVHHRTNILAEALHWCHQQSEPGDAILLSPGCASTDQFRDYMHRGDEFERLVNSVKLRIRAK
jgi:UDP-N-acetylmuramoylalanine--D-glutamate ligase